MYAAAADVRWEVHPTERDAVCREADLLVAAAPPWNAAGSVGAWRWIAVDGDAFTCLPDSPRAPGAVGARSARRTGTYGCFPHLGPGQASPPGTACTDGYPAVLRLLWAAGTDRPFPSALGGGCPERVVVPVADDLRRPLHDLLSGTSRRLVDLVAARLDHRPPFEQPALRRDAVAADGFFAHGPSRLRDLRRRHRFGTGPVTPEQFRAAIAAELRTLLGDDVVLPTPPDPALLGARRSRSLRHTARP
jgi:hypothetical protein